MPAVECLLPNFLMKDDKRDVEHDWDCGETGFREDCYSGQ